MSDRTKDRLMYALKSRGPNTAATLAKHLGVTAVAIRQHLDALLEAELVEFEDLKGTVGRPRRTWRISELGNKRFPDNHGAVLVDLLGNIKDLYGDEGLQRLIDARLISHASPIWQLCNQQRRSLKNCSVWLSNALKKAIWPRF